MDRQARIRDTVLVKNRKMTGRSQTLLGGWGSRGKDDRKQNALAPVAHTSPHVRSPEPEFLGSIPPAYVAWRAGTTTLYLLGS